MIPQISGVPQIDIVAQPSFTYRLTENQISGDIDGIHAVQQAVFHILSTERYAYPIYEDSYGVELEQYKGQSLAFLEATIENTLRDALTQDDRITGVAVVSVERSGRDRALVQIEVTCDVGTFGAEVTVNV